MGSQVERIIASESDPKFATGVEITNKEGQKEVIDADFIVLAVGVSPATEFLKQSEGFPPTALQKDGGVLVDEHLKVRGLEDVFAIGDIAVFPQTLHGGDTRIEHWNVAGNHGRTVGKTISGTPEPFSTIPIFWSGRECPAFSLTSIFICLGCRGPEFEVLRHRYRIRRRYYHG
jgi:NADPH-dependent 2,4-dienoyl-CoA reductase/sulfur reductase-like enzyme